MKQDDDSKDSTISNTDSLQTIVPGYMEINKIRPVSSHNQTMPTIQTIQTVLFFFNLKYMLNWIYETALLPFSFFSRDKNTEIKSNERK
jgi:hypothetical protein